MSETKRPQTPIPMPDGGYFGTHCHICHEAVGICNCVRKDSNALVPLDKEEWEYFVEETMGHIQTMYPQVWATMGQSCRTSIRNSMLNKYAKFGKDNSGMPEFAIIKSIISDCICYAFSFHNQKIGSSFLNDTANQYADKIMAELSQQPPKEPVHDCGCGMGESCLAIKKERKVSLEEIKKTIRQEFIKPEFKYNTPWLDRSALAILNLLKRHC